MTKGDSSRIPTDGNDGPSKNTRGRKGKKQRGGTPPSVGTEREPPTSA
jgi:hypothetical protein